MPYFIVPGKPQGKARARVTKWGTYTPEKTLLYENLIKQCYIHKHKNLKFDMALRMTIITFFDIPKSTSKKNKEAMLNNEIFPTKKPDADNIAKVVCDALNGIAYNDDTQIVELKITKLYDVDPRVEIVIDPVVGERFRGLR